RRSLHALALGRAGEEGVERRLAEDHVVVDQHVVGVELVRRDQVDVLEVAGRQPLQFLVAREHHEHPLAAGQRSQGLLRLLGGGLLALDQRGDDVHLVVARPVGQGTAQGGDLHLLRGALRVVARRRAVDRATAGELRGADRALTGAAGALLAVLLGATAADLATGLRVVRALTGSGQLSHHDLVHQRDVRLDVEDLRGQLHRAVGPTGRGLHLDRRGHAVTPPFAALRTKRRPPFGPGTAPMISSRPPSPRTWWTLRPCVVTRLLPIRPDMRTPLNTRPGVAQPPIEPGVRWLAWLPWLAPWPLKP